MEQTVFPKSEIGSAAWNDDMFKKHATTYKGIAGKKEFFRTKKIWAEIKPLLKDFQVITELGCEAGTLLHFIQERNTKNIQLVGTDISKEALKQAQLKLGDKVMLFYHDMQTDDIPKMPEPNFLICSEVLEHIPNYVKAIESISKIATQNTTVIISVPLEKYKIIIKKLLTKIGLFNVLFKGFENSLSEWHVNDFSKDDICNELNKYFNIQKYKLILGMHHLIVATKKQ
jgi:2-polyprenyl-3-methyl-5-hydroxy-6-metoxy-1,4-benzoquinol methylase